MPWRSVGWSWMWPTVIWGLITWRALMLQWLVMWPVQCVIVMSVAVSSVGWVRSSWAAPVVAASILVLWSRVTSMNQAVMSSKVGLWSASALPVSVFMVVSRTQSGMVTFVQFVMCCLSSWGRYSVLTVHNDMSILITFIAPNVRAVSCDMSWFLTLKQQSSVQHHITCGGWDDHYHELLCSI